MDDSGAVVTPLFTEGNSEAILRSTVSNFSLETTPVNALDARRRTFRLLWIEHLLINGISKKGSSSSPVSLAIVEFLSLVKSISMGHKLGCTTFAMLNFESPEGPLPSSRVATFSSLNRNGCNEGYLQATRFY